MAVLNQNADILVQCIQNYERIKDLQDKEVARIKGENAVGGLGES